MLCQVCGKAEATVHYKSFHLCEKCAEKKAILSSIEKSLFSLGDLLAGMVQEVASQETKQEKGLKCSQCGLSYREFKKMGKLGCSQCYTAFEKELSLLLRRIHGSNSHVGKTIPAESEKIKSKQEVKRLREDLEKAIEREEFEKAAKLRDRIREIEEKMSL